ncbi:putative oxidoreductase C-terminal domain-containing protein [Puia sp. P3]|uniref:putative oxidoreductase C-terminal domain-containing protein n=1 Tax=Puia sp. P3 TaxID=3423952 RepID=UPI003D664F6E
MILPFWSSGQERSKARVRLITLDPGHFHAALVQKSMYPVIDPEVQVYAPGGPELQAHLALVRQYNERADRPTHWKETVYAGADYLQKMIAERKGNVVVMAGNNHLKTEYIDRSVRAGFNALSDKPMAIDTAGFRLLAKAFDEAAAHHVLLYDIMTERSEITNILQKELMHAPAVFGALRPGSAADPSVVMESVHFYYKNVSGKTLTRPDWFFDPAQQGEALADVGTHLLDLVQWICYPSAAIDYKKDVSVLSASTWPTPVGLSQFSTLTGKPAFPAFLKPFLKGDTLLQAHGNGEVTYRLKGVFAHVTARWEYQAPPGSGDTHHAIFKGTKATLEIRQGAEEHYQPTLYILPVSVSDDYSSAVRQFVAQLAARYPGVTLSEVSGGWRVEIPASYKVGHEAHFAQVMQRYLGFLAAGRIPEWEIKGMLAKYYTSTKALEIAKPR